jgi:hypothetical protein
MSIVRYQNETANEAVVRHLVEEHAAGRAFSGNSFQQVSRAVGGTLTQEEAFRLARTRILEMESLMIEVGFVDFKLSPS